MAENEFQSRQEEVRKKQDADKKLQKEMRQLELDAFEELMRVLKKEEQSSSIIIDGGDEHTQKTE